VCCLYCTNGHGRSYLGSFRCLDSRVEGVLADCLALGTQLRSLLTDTSGWVWLGTLHLQCFFPLLLCILYYNASFDLLGIYFMFFILLINVHIMHAHLKFICGYSFFFMLIQFLFSSIANVFLVALLMDYSNFIFLTKLKYSIKNLIEL
jgi:hypothetical protein